MFTLVGTMSYGKGMFAFFDGNNADLRRVLEVSGDVAGYTVTEITLAGVKLQSPDKKQTIPLRVGDLVRQENGVWQFAGRGDLAAGASASTASTAASSSTDASAAPASAGEPNDILKKLMEQREKELK